MAVDFTELKVRVCEALGHMPGVSIDPNGLYYSECYKDYRDELEDSQVADVLAGRYRYWVRGEEKVERMEPLAALNNLLMDCYRDEMWHIEDDVLEALRKDSDVAAFLNGLGLDEEQTNERLMECLQDVWYVTVPVDDYLKQDVCMDIMLDTGDMNYEFTCNNLASRDIESVEDFDDNSSLLWLCEQQGVTREELLAAFDKGTAHSDEVMGLRERKAEIVAELQGFGFVLPKFSERVWHTGAYQEYARLQNRMETLRADIALLTIKYEHNDISYQEYLGKHFERFERLDPMSEEQFRVKRGEVLEHISAKLESANAEYARVKDQLDFGKDYRRIAMLHMEYQDVQRQLGELAKTEEYQKAEFIDSVYNEVNNMSSSIGVVTFLVKMPLEEAIRLQEVVDKEKDVNNSYSYEGRTGRSSLVLGKDVRCGLLDSVNGGGSVFEVHLIRDVEVPLKAIYRAVPDEELGEYGFMSIYGANDEFFEESLKEIREVAPEKVEDLIASAEEKCEGLSMGYDGITNEREIDMEGSL